MTTAVSSKNGTHAMHQTADLVREQAPTGSAVDGRANERRRDGERDDEYLLRMALRQALGVSDALGVTRKAVANGLGVKVDTLEQWVYHSRLTVIPSAHLAALLTGTILPTRARLTLWRALGDSAGLLVVERPEKGLPHGSAHQQLAAIAAVMGQVAAQINLACDPLSEAGANLSAGESAAIERLVKEMEAKCESMLAVLKSMQSGGV